MRYTHDQHLRSLADFSEIRASGTRWECGFFYVVYRAFPGRKPPLRRIGVIASRRIGDAVRRNKAKRLLRETFRNNQNCLPPSCDVILIARPYILRASYQDLERKFIEAIHKVGKS